VNVALRQAMTTGQFLDWEERQPLRYGFDGFRRVAMTGGTVAREMIGGALPALLRERVRGKRCRVAGFDREGRGHGAHPLPCCLRLPHAGTAGCGCDRRQASTRWYSNGTARIGTHDR
jgi:hypothetical protein